MADPDLVVLPAGLHELGLEEPMTVEALLPPAPMIADPYDYKGTRDVTSIFVPADVIDSQVQIALTVVRASGVAVTVDGQSFAEVEKLDDSTETQLAALVRTALERLIAAGDIRIKSITFVTVGTDGLEMTVEYFNLRAPTRENLRKFTRVI